MARLVSKIYGEALFNFAKEQNQTEKMFEEALDIIEVFSSDDIAKEFLTNPKVGTEEKIKCVKELFVDKLWAGPVGKTTKYFKIDGSKGDNPKILDFIGIDYMHDNSSKYNKYFYKRFGRKAKTVNCFWGR